MTDLGYTLVAYALGLGAMLGYALSVMRKLRRHGLTPGVRGRGKEEPR